MMATDIWSYAVQHAHKAHGTVTWLRDDGPAMTMAIVDKLDLGITQATFRDGAIPILLPSENQARRYYKPILDQFKPTGVVMVTPATVIVEETMDSCRVLMLYALHPASGTTFTWVRQLLDDGRVVPMELDNANLNTVGTAWITAAL